jgi:UDPglucose--hexose-1-phosphate uridylyltransferase
MSERRRDPLSGTWRSYRSQPEAADGCLLCDLGGGPTDGELCVLVLPDEAPERAAEAPATPAVEPPYEVAPAAGAAETLVYTGRHDGRLTDLGPGLLARVVEVWADRYAELGGRADVLDVSISETNAQGVHPCARVHGQPELPPLVQAELDAGRRHLMQHGTCPACDVVAQERAAGVRVVARNRTFLAHVPFAPSRPYEVHVTSHRHAPSLLDLSEPERDDLAALVDLVLRAFETVLGPDAGYRLDVRQSPADDGAWLDVTHLRVELAPVASGPVGTGPEEAAAAVRAAAAAVT